MSWSLQTIGSPAALKPIIAQVVGMPDSLKAALTSLLDTEKAYGNMVQLAGFGHGLSFKIEAIQHIPAPEPLPTKGYVS